MKAVSRYYYILPLMVMGVLYYLMYALHPHFNDDIRFQTYLEAYFAEPTLLNFFSGWIESIKETVIHDNGRIPQLLATVIVGLPRWLMSIPMAIAVVVCIYYSAKICGVWMTHPLLYGLLVLLWVFAMPWLDFMFLLMYGANYIIPAAFMLWTLFLFVNCRLKIWSAIILGVICGSSHELYCSAMIAIVFIEMCFYKEYRKGSDIALLLSLIVSLCYLFLLPGTEQRQGQVTLFGGFINPKAFYYVGGLFYLFLIVFASAMSIKKWRVGCDKKVLILSVVGALIGWIVWRMFLLGQRITWCMDIFSVIGIVYLLTKLPLKNIAYKKWHSALGAFFIVVCIAHLSICLPWFYKMHKETTEARNLIPDKNGYVYYDLTKVIDVPLYILSRPNFNIYYDYWYGMNNVIPKRVLDYTHGAGCKIGINQDIYLYKGDMVLPYQPLRSEFYIPAVFHYGDFVSEIQVSARKFKGADGKEYYYISPHYLPFRALGRQITSAEISL